MVTKTEPVNIYVYNARNLWLAYGIAIFITLLIISLGGIAYNLNGVCHERSFSAFVSATRDLSLVEIFSSRHGVLPLDEAAKHRSLIFDDEDHLGMSFREERRNSTVPFHQRKRRPWWHHSWFWVGRREPALVDIV